MSNIAARPTLLSLPVELRLQIAMYVFKQPPDFRKIYSDANDRNENLHNKQRTRYTTETSTSNFSLLLVCHQFRREFTQLAYEQTTIVVRSKFVERIKRLPDSVLRYIRKLVITLAELDLLQWQDEPGFFIRECVRLDALYVAPHTWSDWTDTKAMTGYLRQLKNIRTIHFIPLNNELQTHRNNCYSLIGAILKEDHYERYDAIGAPHLETTWWKWSHNRNSQIFTFTAQDARPVMEEETYMVSVKPLIDDLMEDLLSETHHHQPSPW